MCEERFAALVAQGCDEDVAADRVMDAFGAALGERPAPFDPRDRMFTNQLRTAAGKEIEDEEG